MTTILSTLKAVARPEEPKNNPIIQKRESLLSQLNIQLAMANSLVDGEEYVHYREKWVTNADTGVREKKLTPKRIKPWFYQRNNCYYLEVKVSNKPIELQKGKSAIEVGKQDDVPKAIKLVIEAVIAGELDQHLSPVPKN